MQTDYIELEPDDFAEEAARAFERYDLVSAPVVDPDGKLVGRVTVNTVVDFIREEAESDNWPGRSAEEGRHFRLGLGFGEKPLVLAGHQPGDRLSSPAGDRRLRGSIEAGGFGGADAHRRRHRRQFGNQTITMIVRAIAMGQVSPMRRAGCCARNWASPATINGLLWGGLLGFARLVALRQRQAWLGDDGAMTSTSSSPLRPASGIPCCGRSFGADRRSGFVGDDYRPHRFGGFFIFLGLATSS